MLNIDKFYIQSQMKNDRRVYGIFDDRKRRIFYALRDNFRGGRYKIFGNDPDEPMWTVQTDQMATISKRYTVWDGALTEKSLGVIVQHPLMLDRHHWDIKNAQGMEQGAIKTTDKNQLTVYVGQTPLGAFLINKGGKDSFFMDVSEDRGRLIDRQLLIAFSIVFVREYIVTGAK